MKKICVVTWYGLTNYGTNLQAYALLKKLQLLGYESVMNGVITRTVDYRKHPILLLKKIVQKIRKKIKNEFGKAVVDNNSEREHDAVQRKIFESFYNESFPKLNSNGLQEWKQVCEDYSAFVVGSDQVWNPYYFNPTYMLDFVVDKSNVKKIAYAPSIGVTKIPRKYKYRYKHLLRDFDAVSVREESAKELIADLSPVPVQVVLDPTLLLDQNEWSTFAKPVMGMEPGKYIICYFVGCRSEYWKYVSEVVEKTGLQAVVLPVKGNVIPEEYMGMYNVGPREFVWLIKNSEMVCTDSFHATVFSIIFHKELYVLKRFSDSSKRSQNDRLYGILKSFQLGDRFIEEDHQFIRSPETDFDLSEAILIKKREESVKFLVQAIEA